MENSILGVFRDFTKQLTEALSFGRERNIVGVACIEVDTIQKFDSGCVLNQVGIAVQIGDERRF